MGDSSPIRVSSCCCSESTRYYSCNFVLSHSLLGIKCGDIVAGYLANVPGELPVCLQLIFDSSFKRPSLLLSRVHQLELYGAGLFVDQIRFILTM